MYVKKIILRKKRIKNVKEFIKQNIFIFDDLLLSIENFKVT